MDRLTFAGVCVAVCVAAIPAAASASSYFVTYDGVVESGYDENVFGGVGDLTGQSFQARFYVSTNIGALTHSHDTLNMRDYGILYSYTNLSNPVAIGFLKINGITRSIVGYDYSQVFEENDVLAGGTFNAIDMSTLVYQSDSFYDDAGALHYKVHTESLDMNVSSLIHQLDDSDPTTAEPSYVLGAGDMGIGNFQFLDETGVDLDFVDTVSSQGVLRPTSWTVASAASIPEPSTWALLMMGFGLAGAGLRASRRLSCLIAR